MPAPTHLTLPEVLEEAQAGNRGMKALGHRRHAARHEASALARTRWGELGSSLLYAYLNDDQILRPMSGALSAGGFSNFPFDRKQLHYKLNYRIPLYLGGRLNNEIKIAQLEAEKSQALLESTRWQVRFNVVSLYTAAQALNRVLTALEEQLGALEKTKARLDLMVTEGKRPEVDRLKVVEEVESVKAQRARVTGDRRRIGSLLLSLLGREPTGRVTVEPLPAHAPRLSIDRERLRFALRRNFLICQAELAVEQSESGVKVARSAFLPKIYAKANYLEHTGAIIDRSSETWMAGVTVELPLFAETLRFQKMKAARKKKRCCLRSFGGHTIKAGRGIGRCSCEVRRRAQQPGVCPGTSGSRQ